MYGKRNLALFEVYALREEGDMDKELLTVQDVISIHALREEGDIDPRHPHIASIISIHALREEGDLRLSAIRLSPFAISIHALREEGDYAYGKVDVA